MSQMSQAQRAIEKPHCCSRARLQGDKCHAPLHNGVRSNGTLHRDHLWKVALLLFCLNLAGGILWAQPQLYASPNPIIVASGTTLGATTLQVNAPKYAGHTLSLYVNAPPNATTPGELFAQGGS
jgi:hypothetical protein